MSNNKEPIVLRVRPGTEEYAPGQSGLAQGRAGLAQGLFKALMLRVVAVIRRFFCIEYLSPEWSARNFMEGTNYLGRDERELSLMGNWIRYNRSLHEYRGIFGCLLAALYGPVTPYFRSPALVAMFTGGRELVYAYRLCDGRIMSVCAFLPGYGACAVTYKTLKRAMNRSNSVHCGFGIYNWGVSLDSIEVILDAELFKRKFEDAAPLRKNGERACCKRRKLDGVSWV